MFLFIPHLSFEREQVVCVKGPVAVVVDSAFLVVAVMVAVAVSI